jgi:phage repressor protein C with HTH and peptisase S24 domain
MQKGMNLERQLIDHLKRLSDEREISELAERAGVDQSNIARAKDGKQNLGLDKVSKLLDALGVTISFPGEEKIDKSIIRRIGINAPMETVSGEGLKTINVYQKAGAGVAHEFAEIEPLFSISVPQAYFRRSDFAVLINGHSMEPTIASNSVVGAQKNFEFSANELYVVNIPYEGLVVKRVAITKENTSFILKSDNPDKDKYPSREIPIAESEEFLVGRVVWVLYRY